MWFHPSVTQEPKNLHELTLDLPTMDLRLHTNPELHYGINGAASRSPRPGVSKVPPIQKSTGLRSSCSLTATSKLKHHLHVERGALWIIFTWLHADGVKRQLGSQNVSTAVRCWLFAAPIGCLWTSKESAVCGVKRSFQQKKNWFVKTRWSS